MKIPERGRTTTHPDADVTPLFVETSAAQRMQPHMDQPQEYGITEYEGNTPQDFAHNQVFVDIDVFMAHVLHVPEDWEVSWDSVIRKIKCDSAFLAAHRDFTRRSGTQGAEEWRPHKSLVDMTNVVVEFSDMLPDAPAKPRTRAHHLGNDKQGAPRRLTNDPKTDVIAVHSSFLPYLRLEEREQNRLAEPNPAWAQPLQLLEVKSLDCALVDGSCMPRLRTNGKPIRPRGEVLWLTRVRTRSTRRPRVPSRTIATSEERDDVYNCRESCLAGDSTVVPFPKTTCGRVARIRPKEAEVARKFNSRWK